MRALARGENRPLVGRIEEMRSLREVLKVCADGGTAAVSVSGEPGIGKTRLLQEACKTGQELGFRILTGGATELEREIPYSVLVDALDQPLGALPDRQLRALGAKNLAELGRFLPSLRTWAAPLSAATWIERQQCHHSVRMTLQYLAEQQPVVLVLDDVHWADHASLEIIAHLLRSGVPRCALLLAHRTAQLPEVHAAALNRAAYEGILTSLGLGPLSLTETAQLLGGQVRGQELAELHHDCGGNPFYVRELAWARGGPHDAVDDRAGGGDSGRVPAVVQGALDQEIRALSSRSRRLLYAAAVAGEPFDLGLAVLIAGLAEDEIAATADELVATQLVQETKTFGRLSFRHPLFRRAVYERSGYGWRRAAHRRAAQVLTARGADLSLRAHHIEHSSDIGDPAAVAVLAEAGAAAAARAPVTAVRWFRAALRLLPADAATEQRLTLVMALSEVLNACGRLRESRDVLRAVVELASSAAPADHARMLVMLAATEQGLGNTTEGQRLLTAALMLAPPDSVEAASYKLELAKSHMVLGAWDRAVAILAELKTTARSRADRRLHFLATAASAYLATTQLNPRLDDGLSDLDESARTLDTLTDCDVAPGLLGGLADVVYADVCFERWTVGVEHADRGIQLCRSTGRGQHVVDLIHLKAVALLVQGSLERALAEAENAVETALVLDHPPMVAMTEATRCWALSLLGHTRQALTVGARSVNIAAQVPRGVSSWHASLSYGAALIENGQYEHGREQITTVGGYREFGEILPTSLPYWLRWLVEAEVELGRLDRAAQVVEHLEVIAETAPMMRMRIGDARYARSRLLLARGEVNDAAVSARVAVAAYEKSGTLVEAARSRLLLGRILSGIGDFATAERELGAALSVATHCGAATLVERVRRVLDELEVEPGRSRQPCPAVSVFADLTSRQREIVNRVVLGKTNRQISTELHVSEKTVEAHLSRLFTRLGVASRTELAARAVADRARRGT